MSEEQQRYLLILIRKRGKRKIFLGGEVPGTQEPWTWTSSGEERFSGIWGFGWVLGFQVRLWDNVLMLGCLVIKRIPFVIW